MQGGKAEEGSSLESTAAQNHKEQPVEQHPTPAFSGRYGEVDLTQDGFDTKARIANDGRVNININQQSQKLSDLLVPALRSQLNLQQDVESAVPATEQTRPILGGIPAEASSPPLNVVIHVVGSRGDVQPFVALGKVLKDQFGHRVRLATHPTFRSFTEENGLEFFSIGGDPAELMAFMVKNPGLMPGMDSLRSGDVGKRRKGMYEIIHGCWRSCIEIGDGTGTIASDDSLESLHDSTKNTEDKASAKPFVADAIIANPPSFAHIHCAEKLGIPLHLMFTMPWSPTQAFPHPLANIQSSNADQSITNFMSYALVEMMTWQGLGDIINRFREKSLGLEPVSLMWAPGMASRLRIPYTYCWSPALIPKPKDWGNHISISGFYFLSLASHFTPDPDLATFLEAGSPPIYIGFGSIVVDDPNAMTRTIFDAVKQTGRRALVSKGWGGLGSDLLEIPDNVFMLGNVPHDWLFRHVSCVVHHGGAGTTAAGIAAGKPTVVVPFFGDQPFWGSMVAKAGAGPWPIPYKQLTAEKLAAAIFEALQPEALQRAEELGASIGKESGADSGAKDFQEKLDVDSLRCSVAPGRAAAWRVKRTNIRLSSFAVTVLGAEGLLDFNNLKLYRPREYDAEDGPWDPITGATSAIMGTVGSMMMGVADLPIEILRALHIKPPTTSGINNSISASSRSIASDISTSSHKTSLSATSIGESDILSPLSSRESLMSSSTATGVQETTPVSSHSIDEAFSNSPADHSKPAKQQLATSSQDNSHRKSMAKVYSCPRSRSSSRDRSSAGSPLHRSSSDNQSGQISLDAAVGAGKGIGRIVGAGFKSPMDFTLSIARGFHNAPKLYGDESVRHSDKVTGIRSGLKAAGKEFGYGLYDGISGLVTQPINGAKQEGVTGFLKGFGKGIGGVILKPQAAVMAIPAYTMNGIYKELQKQFGSSVQNYIVAARTAQGYEELAASTQQQRLDVVQRWQATQMELHKEKERVKHDTTHPNCVFLRMKHATHSGFEAKKSHAHGGKLHKSPAQATHGYSTRRRSAGTAAPPQPSVSADALAHADTSTFEEAIQSSVQATSRGNPREDTLIEKAIRASVLELRAASKAGDTSQAIQRAIQASVEEAAHERQRMPNGDVSTSSISDNGLRLSLQQSLSCYPSAEVIADDEPHSSEVQKRIDGNLKSTFGEPNVVEGESLDEDDIQLEQVMEQSRLDHEQYVHDLEKERAEEDIVLEYIKRQSLLEKEHRRSLS